MSMTGKNEGEHDQHGEERASRQKKSKKKKKTSNRKKSVNLNRREQKEAQKDARMKNLAKSKKYNDGVSKELEELGNEILNQDKPNQLIYDAAKVLDDFPDQDDDAILNMMYQDCQDVAAEMNYENHELNMAL